MEYIKSKDAILHEIVKAIRFQNICSSDLRNYRTEIERLYKESADDMRKGAQLTGMTMSEAVRLGKKMEYAALETEREDF